MIDVEVSEKCLGILGGMGLTVPDLEHAVNNRTQGMIDKGYTRITCTHWTTARSLMFVEAMVVDKEYDHTEGCLLIRKVCVELAIALTPNLPAGRINTSMNIEEVLGLVAESFGIPLRCERKAPFRALVSGTFEPGYIEIENAKENKDILTVGAFHPGDGSCFCVWAFDASKYFAWRGGMN